MQSITFRISEKDLRDLNAIVDEMRALTSMDLRQSDVLRMLIRERARKQQTYGPSQLPNIICKRDESKRAVVIGVKQDWDWRSEGGFEWGYRGTGPQGFALNILLAATGDRDFAYRHHMRFLDEVVSLIPEAGEVLYADEVLKCVARYREDDLSREARKCLEDTSPD